MRHIDIYIFHFYFYLSVPTPSMYFSCTEDYVRPFWCDLMLHLDTAIQYNKLCSFYVSASLYPLVLLAIGRITLIPEYTVLIGDPIAVQILTHNPSLSSVSRYPDAFEFLRAEARHHQPNLPRAPTPGAFARVSITFSF